MPAYRLAPLLPLFLGACSAQVAAPPAVVASAPPTPGASLTVAPAATATPTVAPTGVPTPTATPWRSVAPTPAAPIDKHTFATLGGTVREADGRGAAGVEVRLRRTDAGPIFDKTCAVENGTWWDDELPFGATFEVVASRGDWRVKQEVGPIGPDGWSVDALIPPAAGAIATEPGTWGALTPAYSSGCPSPCPVEPTRWPSVQGVYLPPRIRRGQRVHAHVVQILPDSCSEPDLPACKAIVDAGSRTVRFELAGVRDTEIGCSEALRSASVFMPFAFPTAGPWTVQFDREGVPSGYEVRAAD